MLKALIVENNTKLREKIKAILELKLPFATVNEASDTEETLKKMELDPPNFVLMDIRLENENGLSLIKKIKGKYPKTIIIVNSHSDSIEYQMEAVRVGAKFFLSKKTHSIADLLSLIKSIRFEIAG
jgi:DNA-binding NarL/FixJ family response regulator